MKPDQDKVPVDMVFAVDKQVDLDKRLVVDRTLNQTLDRTLDRDTLLVDKIGDQDTMLVLDKDSVDLAALLPPAT
jgi:hypothetical protein